MYPTIEDLYAAISIRGGLTLFLQLDAIRGASMAEDANEVRVANVATMPTVPSPTAERYEVAS